MMLIKGLLLVLMVTWDKEGTSDSDESASGKVHRKRYTQPGNKSGTLSESLDRITRSKSKQRKISGSEKLIAVVEDVSAALDCLNNDVVVFRYKKDEVVLVDAERLCLYGLIFWFQLGKSLATS